MSGAACKICKREITSEDLKHNRVSPEVTGYAKPRAAGGANAIRLAHKTGAQAHNSCIDSAVGGFVAQEGLGI